MKLPSRCGLGAFAILAGLALGCSDRLKTYPVSGEIYVDNKPADGCVIYLIPTSGLPANAPRPFAKSEKDGSFTLSSYLANDGAPAGQYTVIFQWPEPSAGVFASGFDGKDQLGGAYYEKEQSKFQVTIEKKPNVLPRFNLSKPPQ